MEISERTFEFGVRIVKLINSLPKTPAGFAIASQLVRSGTSIGANVQEAQSAGSKKDFIHCLNISLKEARETKYWLNILERAELVPKNKLNNLIEESDQIIKVLYTIIRNTKKNIIDN